MPDSIDINELDDEHSTRGDYRRANGAPLVSDPSDPDKSLRYSRPSGYGKPLDDENALVNWKINKSMLGVALSPALSAQVAAVDQKDKPSLLALRNEALNKGAANEAADMGTALHAMTHRMENPEDDWEPPEQYAGDLDAYLNTIRQYGLISEMIEVPMVNDDWKAAGTADRIYRTTVDLTAPDGSTIQAGTLLLGDIKTGKSLDFSPPGYSVQMAIYATGQLYDVVTEKRLATPPINQLWTVLVHLPVGKSDCNLYFLSIEVGNHGAYLAHLVKEWRNRWKSNKEFGYDCYPVPVPPLSVEAVASQLDATVVEFQAGDLEALIEYCGLRIKAIGKNEEAKQKLLRSWPSGLPTPKQGIKEPGHMVELLGLLDRIERDFSIPFPAPDPRGLIPGTDNERGLVAS
jgi:hypothetical protein